MNTFNESATKNNTNLNEQNISLIKNNQSSISNVMIILHWIIFWKLYEFIEGFVEFTGIHKKFKGVKMKTIVQDRKNKTFNLVLFDKQNEHNIN